MKRSFFTNLFFPRWLTLGIMGWDDLLVMAAGSVISAGANKAMQGDQSFKADTFGQTPEMQTQEQDPFAWVEEILRQRESRNAKIGGGN